MPVVRMSEGDLAEGNRPEWCRVTGAGVWTVPAEGGRFDRHYHDFPEYWLIYAGRAKIVSEGVEYYVGPGDIVCTNAGDEHDVIEVYETLEAFYFEEARPPDGRIGHLHRGAEADCWHDVFCAPLPADFPG